MKIHSFASHAIRHQGHPLQKTLVALLAIGWITFSLTADAATSTKRGLVSPELTPADLQTAAEGISWWYNWSALPGEAVSQRDTQQDAPFVPMVWGSTLDEEALRRYLDQHPEVEYILGFNEPNFVSQANLTPQQAADRWPQIESIADAYSLKIVGPSVNYSPGGVDIPGTDDNGSPFAYLDAFFQACTQCRVDAIGVHGYMAAPEYFKDYIAQFHERYQKPIWVTEWNLDRGGEALSTEAQMDFLADTTRWMEAQDYVTHYAWFLGRGNTSSDLLSADNQWTALGQLYQGIPGNVHHFTLPGRIEAEHAHQIRGFHHRTTTEAGRRLIQLFSDADDALMQFNVVSAQQSIYRWTLKYATAGDARIAVRVDDHDEQIITLPDTGNTYYWAQHSLAFSLPAGPHRLSLRVLSGRPNFEWLSFQE
ncbi:glycosyl hydrolase [Vreelandella sp. TE19]